MIKTPLDNKILDSEAVKVLDELVKILQKRKCKLFLYIFPSIGDMAERIKVEPQKITESINQFIKLGLIHGEDSLTIESDDDIYLLAPEDLHELNTSNTFRIPENPDIVVKDAKLKTRQVFIIEPLTPIEAFELTLDYLINPNKPFKELSFQDWIKGFEDRYSEQELFLMRWIWGIRSEAK